MRRRRHLSPPPHPAPVRPSPPVPFLSRHPPPHSALAHPSTPAPFLSRHPPVRFPATPFNWNCITTYTLKNLLRIVSPTAEPEPPMSFSQVVARSSPSLPLAALRFVLRRLPLFPTAIPHSVPSSCPSLLKCPLCLKLSSSHHW
ncbi:hypothetical protein AMTRI_Chr09g15830 [Amborella trichopoda]